MPVSDYELDGGVAVLRDHTFTTDQLLAAVDMSGAALIHCLHRVKPTLCSETAGQGRARQFKLLDVYIIALLDALTQMTRKAPWSAKALSELTFEDVVVRGKVRSNVQRRREICADIVQAHPLYWTRETAASKSWAIAATQDDIAASFAHLRVHTLDTIAPALHHSRGTIVLNATSVLRHVDRRLLTLIEPDVNAAVG